jgi:hypothetical protein
MVFAYRHHQSLVLEAYHHLHDAPLPSFDYLLLAEQGMLFLHFPLHFYLHNFLARLM